MYGKRCFPFQVGGLLLLVSLILACGGGKGGGPLTQENGYLSVLNRTQYQARVDGWYLKDGEEHQIADVRMEPEETHQITESLPGGTEVHLTLYAYVSADQDEVATAKATITLNGNTLVIITNASNIVVEYTITGG